MPFQALHAQLTGIGRLLEQDVVKPQQWLGRGADPLEDSRSQQPDEIDLSLEWARRDAGLDKHGIEQRHLNFLTDCRHYLGDTAGTRSSSVEPLLQEVAEGRRD